MAKPAEVERCPDCRAELVSEAGIPGLCPLCLLSLALKDSDPPSDPEEAETLHRAGPGRILGERYQVREMLGRGGMGEVFRAFDLKLRLDVALKAVRAGPGGPAESERLQNMLRREVRSAREVVSPNVCRIFDLVVEDGQELVSMEYIDGTTLSESLRQVGPLPLRESREIASQFLSGLEAIHQAGLVHRDFKPENVMLTRAGRVVVMDFGLAKARTEGRTRTISGTPAYMAPEQARGEAVDARADVFSAGVVLAEMLSVGGEANLAARQALWRAVRETPPRVPEGPWAPVLRQCLAPHPEERPASANALARALEEVTLRLPGFEEKRPYPGLASFSEQDAEYFFGREVEVEAIWKKLKRPRLLALIGPSGAGKSSFLRAGLLPTLPSTWRAVMTTPGSRPFQALAETLVPVFSGDTEAMQALLRFEDPETAVQLLKRYRKRHEHVLLIVDQFEELFTLNPLETQEAFARLLGRLVLEADVHVVLSLRDDFLFLCHAHESLAPAFSDLTPLGPLSESGLRRALVQPALACGYRFEDESLVDEMVSGVARERGALPLLAFAASRLWEKRDHERGLLTRDAYREIGGVAGALAQHAEATLGTIGTQRIPLVRELFRNLVTSQGTRAVRERGELLSVFAQEQDPKARTEAEEVLNALVDARLLTSYERAGEGGESHQQVEIIHESLLKAWPRLVRWQTQDADGAQLRDQLRLAAQVWQDRGQHEDLLWSGQAYLDFALWRERHPVPLTSTEEVFSRAMRVNATRRTRRRRATVAAVISVAVAVAVATSVLWRRAQAETLRAEAGKLLVLGERELSTYPTGALAYTLKSLELSDTEAGRLLALRVLQRAPLARLAPMTKGIPGNVASDVDFSPNGEWVALGGRMKAEVIHRNGEKRAVLGDYAPHHDLMQARFGPNSDVLVTDLSGDIRVWSVPDGRELRRGLVDDGPSSLRIGKDGFLTLTRFGEREIVRSWPIISGEPRVVGSMESPRIQDATDRALAYAQGRAVYLRSLEDWAVPPRLVLEQPTDVQNVALSPDGARIATLDAAGDVRIWPTATRVGRPERVVQAPDTERLRFDPAGRWLAATATVRGHPNVRLFDLAALPGTDPLVLQRGDISSVARMAFDPSGRWLATAHEEDAAFWPLDPPRALVLRGHRGAITSLLFTPDGRWLLSASQDGTARAWPLRDPGSETRILLEPLSALGGMALDPTGQRLAVSTEEGQLLVVRLDGGPALTLEGFSAKAALGVPAFDESGRRVAVGTEAGPRDQKMARVWDLETGAVRAFGPLPGAGNGPMGGMKKVSFQGQDRLLASVAGVGMVSFNLTSGASRVVAALPSFIGDFSVSRDGRFGVATNLENGEVPGRVVRFRLEDGTVRPLPSHGTRPNAVALDPGDSLIATSSTDGTIRIGPASGEEPHLLLGHEGDVHTVAFSPDGRWLASAGAEFTIRLWPVPDMSKPPLHRRPYDELLAVLRSHTNLRAVKDAVSSTGYKLEPGPFPGWAEPPQW